MSNALALDTFGNLYVVGNFSDTVDLIRARVLPT